MGYVPLGHPRRQACSCSDQPEDSGPGTCRHTWQLVKDNRPQEQGTIKLWSRYDHSQAAGHLLTNLDLHFFSPKYQYKNPPHIHSHNHTQTDLKAIWTRWARMSWASSVMRFRSLSCLMKLSSSEALAIQKASAPAIFFCFCNVSTTATHRKNKKDRGVVRVTAGRTIWWVKKGGRRGVSVWVAARRSSCYFRDRLMPCPPSL